MTVPALTECGREEQQARASYDHVALPDGMGAPPHDGISDRDLNRALRLSLLVVDTVQYRMPTFNLTLTLVASATMIIQDWAKTAFSNAARLSCPSYVADDRPRVASNTMVCVATVFQTSAPMCTAADANRNIVLGRTILT